MHSLYTKTEYSLLDNTIKLKELVNKAVEFGYHALSITDDNMYGVYKFYCLCVENNIKPIIGFDAVIESKINVSTRILLYCKDINGYHNLVKLSSLQQIKKIIPFEDLMKYKKGIIAISCDNNDINFLLRMGKKPIKEIEYYHQVFESFYIGLEPQLLTFDDIVKDLIDIANNTNTLVLPLSKTLYLEKYDEDIYRHLHAINNNTTIDKTPFLGGEFHFKNKSELQSEFADFPYAFDNLEKLLSLIDVSICKTKNVLPSFPNDLGLPSKDYLNKLCENGLKKRLRNTDKNYKEYQIRLEYEMSVILKMNYEDYFLIVWDFVKYAKTNDIYVGPGRGSAAGSLVSYCLGITDVDPLEYGLLFERFLNPERISMPDIDMDFPHLKRNDVITYVQKKYGKYNVAHIITYDTFKARSAIRDVAKVMNISQLRLEETLKYVDSNDDLLNISNQKLIAMKRNDEINNLLKVASKIIGLPRHTGVHAAGIIISHDMLTEDIPILVDNDGFLLTQFEASDLEKLGLLKIDFLGLKNLTMISDVVKSIEKNEGIVLDMRKIPLDDKKTFDFLASGNTTGLFQLESEGMKKVLRKLKPNSINDIVSILALYRPGPMENIDEFIARKNGKKFTYLHPLLEDILKETYGIIVYQEQIMQIANRFAQYSLGEADVLRKAVSKKQQATLEEQRNRFVESSKYDKDISNEIYDYIVKFANYGFNKSHSVAYGLVSYQTAYLKANYPLYFMTELLNNVIGDEKKTKEYILEAKGFNIECLPPLINKSVDSFQIENKAIRYPLLGIKNIGFEVVKEILKLENKNYYSVKNVVSSRCMESLIKAGCFTDMTIKRMLDSLHDNLNYQAFIDDEIIKTVECSGRELIEFEKEALGFNLSHSPLDEYKEIISSKNLLTISQISTDCIGQKKSVIGFISKIKEITTKNNEKMAFFWARDGIIEIEGFIFPKTYAQLAKIELNKVYIMDVRVVFRNSVLQLELLTCSKGDA